MTYNYIANVLTCIFYVPNAALYQAEPHPAFLHYSRWRGGFQAAASRSISFPAGPF